MKEIKCDICGTINDGSTDFCKGCFQKLNAERKQNVVEEEKVTNVIENEEVRDVPWNNDDVEVQAIETNIPEVENWDMVSVNSEEKKHAEEPEVVEEQPVEEVVSEEVPAETVEPVPVEVESDQNVVSLETPVEVVEEQPVEPDVQVTETEEIEQPEVVAENNQPEQLAINFEETSDTEPVEEVPVETVEPLPVEVEPDQKAAPLETPVEVAEEQPTEIPEEAVSTEEIIQPEATVEEQSVEVADDVVEPVPIEENEIVEEVKPAEEIIEPIAELDAEPQAQLETNDDWSNDPVEDDEVKGEKVKYLSKFTIVYIISMVVIFGGLLITEKDLGKLFDNATKDIVSFALYRLAALLTLLIAAKVTFFKQVPEVEKLNKVTFKILFLIAVPSIIIQLFVLGFVRNTKVLMFIVGIMLSLIVLVIFFSYIRNLIKKKNNVKGDDKVFFIYGIVNIVLIIGLLGFGMYARSNNLDMPRINFVYKLFHDVEKDEEIVEKFINQTELNIIKYQTEYANYEIPSVIDDVSYAAFDDYTPEEINLILNKEGAIISGTIKYNGYSYKYNGQTLKVE